LVPKPTPDFDLPDAVCTLEALVLANYVVQPSNDIWAAAPESFSIANVTAATGADTDVTIVDGVLLMANGFTGDIEICYDEISTDPVSGLDCSVSDCEVINPRRNLLPIRRWRSKWHELMLRSIRNYRCNNNRCCILSSISTNASRNNLYPFRYGECNNSTTTRGRYGLR